MTYWDEPTSAEIQGCTKNCGRPERGLICRCTCRKCGGHNLKWVAWGHYLDKDLVCQDCGFEQDDWNC